METTFITAGGDTNKSELLFDFSRLSFNGELPDAAELARIFYFTIFNKLSSVQMACFCHSLKGTFRSWLNSKRYDTVPENTDKTWENKVNIQYGKFRNHIVDFLNKEFTECTVLQDALIVAFNLHVIDGNLKMKKREYKIDETQKAYIRDLLIFFLEIMSSDIEHAKFQLETHPIKVRSRIKIVNFL